MQFLQLAGDENARRARLLDGAGGREPRAERASRSCRRRSPPPRSRCSTGRSGTRLCSRSAARAPTRCPRSASSGQPLAEVRGRPDCVLEGGTIDAMGEQIVAGCRRRRRRARHLRHHADRVGRDRRAGRGRRATTRSRTPRPGKFLVGGPSNAGGLFLNWVDRMLARRRRGRRPIPAACPGVGAVSPRRARAVPGLRRAARSSSTSTSRTTPRRCGAPRSRRRVRRPAA